MNRIASLTASALPSIVSPDLNQRTEHLPRSGVKTAWLGYFVYAARSTSLQAACNNLGITAQALLRNLEKLEQYLQCTLLVCRGDMIELSTEGEMLLSRLEPLFQRLTVLRSELRQSSGSVPQLQVAWADPLLQPDILRLGQRLKSACPELLLRFRHFSSVTEAEDAYLAGDCDLLLGSRALDAGETEVVQGPLSPFVIAVSPDADGNRAYGDWNYALLQNAQSALPAWLEKLSEQQCLIETGSLHALLELARNGHCAVFLPQCVLSEWLCRGELVKLACPPVQHFFSPRLYWHKNRSVLNAKQAFILSSFFDEPLASVA